MDSVYKVLPIEGKGLGCVASRELKLGKLILQEIPQFVVPENTIKNELSVEFMSVLMDTFKNMSKTDQEQFLKLHNRFIGDDKLDKFLNEEKSKNQEACKMLEEAIQIYGIYKTNTFFNDVLIKFSRFNHSCDSNGEIVWKNREKKEIEIRAASKINYGDEITINYNIVQNDLKKFKERQELLSKIWGFDCNCNLCEREQVNSDDDKYDEFENFSKEARERHLERKNNSTSMTDAKLNREIFCYKEMYKFAKEKRAPRQYLIRNILTPAWETAFRDIILLKPISSKFKKNLRWEMEL